MARRVSDPVATAILPSTMRQRGVAKAVLRVLADKADNLGENAFPSVATIATESHFCERVVQRALIVLERASVIAEQAPARQHRPRTWRINVRLLEAIRGTPESPLNSRGVPESPLNSRGAPESPLSRSEVHQSHPSDDSGVTLSVPRGDSGAPDPKRSSTNTR